MTSGTLRHLARRHPFILGVAVLILGPYILAFLLIFVAFYVIAVALDTFGGRK